MFARVVVLLLVPVVFFLVIEKGGNTMITSKSQAGLDTRISPVDEKVPSRIETATFALG